MPSCLIAVRSFHVIGRFIYIIHRLSEARRTHQTLQDLPISTEPGRYLYNKTGAVSLSISCLLSQSNKRPAVASRLRAKLPSLGLTTCRPCQAIKTPAVKLSFLCFLVLVAVMLSRNAVRLIYFCLLSSLPYILLCFEIK